MQDTVYCFRLLSGRQNRALLYGLCSIPAVGVIWLLTPDWPFWTVYIAWAVACTAILVHQYAAPVPIRCPQCGHLGLHPAVQTPEEQGSPDIGIMLHCRSCGSIFHTDAYIPWPGKSIRRRPVSPDEQDEKQIRTQTGLLPPERKAGRMDS